MAPTSAPSTAFDDAVARNPRGRPLPGWRRAAGAAAAASDAPLPPPPPLSVFRDAVSEAEEARLVAGAGRWLARKPYEEGHFDRVITSYREAQKPLRSFGSANRGTLERLAAFAFPELRQPPPPSPAPLDTQTPRGGAGGGAAAAPAPAASGASTLLLPVHILELGAAGFISQHVDHVEYSGGSIVGLSLLADAVMTLHHVGPHAAATRGGGQGAAAGGGDGRRPDQAAEGAPWLPMLLRGARCTSCAARRGMSGATPSSRPLGVAGRPRRRGRHHRTARRRIAMIFRDRPRDEQQHFGRE